MASVNVSYINTYHAPNPEWARIRRALYKWSLLGFSLLDVVLLFWLLTPVSAQPTHQYRLVPNESAAAVSYVSDANAAKPSPLGSVIVRKAKTQVKAR